MAFISTSGVDIGLISNLSTSTFNTLGEINAGSVGPRYMFLMPRESSVSSMQTAFCSYHESTSVKGKSFTPHLKAADIAELKFVEAVLAAGQGQDDRVLGGFLGKLGVVVAT